MPVSCSTSVLTGQDGQVYFQPPGTEFCLLDSTDFPAGTKITVPTTHDYQGGDPVTFNPEGGAEIDSALAYDTIYYIRNTGTNWIEISATKGGSPITLAGDGGESPGSGVDSVTEVQAGVGYRDGTYTGVIVEENGVNTTARATVTVTAGVPAIDAITNPGYGYEATAGGIRLKGGADGSGNTVDSGNVTTEFTGTAVLTSYSDTPSAHIGIDYARFNSVCQVRDFTLEITREELEITTLPCGTESGTNQGKYVQFRTYQAGYGDGTGSMTVYFTADQESLANRMLRSVILRSQEGAEVKLYVNHVINSAGTGPDDGESAFIQAPISISSMSLSADPDNPQQATLNYRLSGQPTHMFNVAL